MLERRKDKQKEKKNRLKNKIIKIKNKTSTWDQYSRRIVQL